MTERSRARGVWWLLGILLAVVLVYLASPYFSSWMFLRALRADDRPALESGIDFRAVRQSLKEQLRGRVPKSGETKKGDAFAGIVARLAPGLIDQLVDAFVTPDGIAALLEDPEIARSVKGENPPALAHVGEHRHRIDWSRVQRARFTGPRTFMLAVGQTQLEFRFSKMRWTLKQILLPPEA